MLLVFRFGRAGGTGAGEQARKAANRGISDAILHLVKKREQTGDPEGAETLVHEVVDSGSSWSVWDIVRKRWPFGLDPDGKPTPQWERL